MIIFINNFIQEYGNTILYTVIMAVISYVGILIKKFLDDTYIYFVKKETINIVCKTVEHLYSDCSGEEKLNKAMSIAKEMFIDKNIKIGDLELRLLLEYSVCSLDKGV